MKTKNRLVQACQVVRKWTGMLALVAVTVGAVEDARKDFSDPPLKYSTRPLWFWADTPVAVEGVRDHMQKARDKSGYGGFGILPFNRPGTDEFRPKYLSDEYFEVYGAVLAKAKKLGMAMCLYDEFGFPSGSAGGKHGDGVPRFKNKYPGHTIKRLDKAEKNVVGPTTYSAAIPSNGKLMSLVAMETTTKKRVNLTDQVENGQINWSVPAGQWKIMTFMNVSTANALCDYLDPDACGYFVEITHEAYYKHFKKYFGTTIDGTFFDEPTIYHEGGRVWTGAFNKKFKARYGYDPAPYYPALWYDIGPETAAARTALFGFRAELYAEGFSKVIQDWATAHGITATGHQDQEEVINQTAISGDLMLSMKYQDIPGIDKIGGNRPAERFYKVISSIAYNWDKGLVMSETYGAMGDISWDVMYHVAMDQYAKGINQLIPHAVWYDNHKVVFKPELSWRHPKYADRLPQYNKYMGRLNVLLQNHGRHVADIAMLYPVKTMQAEHYMDGPLGQYKGGVSIPELDYVDVSALLSDEIGRDFTYLHPEVLNEKCTVDGDELKLFNPVNYENFKVMIMPGHTTVSWANLKKIQAFYDQGGKVIATGTLPYKSAEFGHDADVISTIKAMFPGASMGKAESDSLYSASTSWSGYGPELAFDGSDKTRWNAADKSGCNQWLQVSFGEEFSVNQVAVHEMYDRTTAYRIQYMKNGQWANWTSGSSLGKKELKLKKVTTSKVRLCFDQIKSDSASVAEFSVTLDGQSPVGPKVERLITSSNSKGGMAVFLRKPLAESLRETLDAMVDTYDVEFESGKELRYIHKVKDGREIFFFANLGKQSVSTWVELRGNMKPELWNPHTGAIQAVKFTHADQGSSKVTRVKLDLDPVQSVFVVAEL